MLSHNGSECDKIGVSMETFHNQNNKCQVVKNNCLKNQIHSLISEDHQRKAKGTNFKYVLDSKYFGTT